MSTRIHFLVRYSLQKQIIDFELTLNGGTFTCGNAYNREGFQINIKSSEKQIEINDCGFLKTTQQFRFPPLIFFLIFIALSGLTDCYDSQSYSEITDNIFLDPAFYFENSWRLGVSSGDSFLESNPIACGQKTSFSVDVNYDVKKIITFKWKKIGTNAKLMCFYGNTINNNNYIICESHKWTPARITIPPGSHTVTWQLSVDECDDIGGPGSVASIDDLFIPKSISKMDCEIKTNETVYLGQESIAYITPLGSGASYDWTIISGGIIKSQKPFSNKIIWKATEVGPSEIRVNVSTHNGTCSNTENCVVLERDLVEVYNYTNLNDMISKSENKILLLNDGIYTDEIIIRVKNIKIASKNLSGAVFDIRGADYGIVIDNTTEVSVEGLNLTDCSGGFIIYNSSCCSINNNVINSKMKPGVFMDLSSSNSIKNNTFNFSSIHEDQAIRLNDSSNNILDNNSIITDGYIFLIDDLSCNNTFRHDFCRFPGKVFNFDDKINCTIDCNGYYRHELRCEDHLENRQDCIKCISCDEIGKKNNWMCI